MITSGTIMSIGDAISQTVFEKKNLKNFNFQRTLTTFAMGSTYSSINGYIWYFRILPNILKILPAKSYAMRYPNVSKVVLESLVFAPYALMCYLFFSNYLYSFNMQQAKESVQKRFRETYKTNLCVWPLINFVSFVKVPVMYWMLVFNFFSLFWGSYLAFLTAKQNNF